MIQHAFRKLANISSLVSDAPSAAGQAAGSQVIRPTATPLVRFDGIRKTYDGRTLVVRELDLDIRQGEFLTLLGPSGSGKTTTLMMLAGFESPTAGEILLAGMPITRTPPHKRNFGMVFQNYALFPHLTVGQNVAYPLTVRKVPAHTLKQRVDKALSMVRLDGLGDRFPSQLSGGQQQRVALARAMVFEPKLVLMDEPLGALDKQLREHMQIELKELHRQLGVTFVYVTHDQDEALAMSDRVAVFNNGAIQQIDAVEKMYETPANRFVAGFIGDSTVLRGEVRAVEGERCAMALPDGTVLRGINVNQAEVGDTVEACIRPERIVLHRAPPAERLNLMQVRVNSVMYFGDHLRLLCAAGAAQAESVVKLSLSTETPPTAGDSVWLELPAEFARIYALS